uniref:Reticulon-like protein n=1 Tax=Oryza barthii TaxID=65489 RepID=A0A0D3EWA9_9ORYZ
MKVSNFVISSNFQTKARGVGVCGGFSRYHFCITPLFLPCAFLPFPPAELLVGLPRSERSIHPPSKAMDASDQGCRLLGAQRSLHGLLGGGAMADVVLWRRKEVAGWSLAAVAASWVLFYCLPGYTLLSFVSSVLMIVLAVLFVWAKAARLLNRPPPPVPLIKISEDSMSKAAAAVGNILHKALQGFENIAHGKDSSLFYKMASVLLLISIVGRVTDLITLVYACLVLALTIPALVDKYEENIAKFLNQASANIQACGKAWKAYKSKIKN